jgi:uncharacterized C2H2 Zn-finger protein
MSSIFCSDCNEENFSTANFCKKCSADFNKRELYSRFLNKSSAYKSRRDNAILLDLLDVLEEYGGPWGLSARLNRPR